MGQQHFSRRLLKNVHAKIQKDGANETTQLNICLGLLVTCSKCSVYRQWFL